MSILSMIPLFAQKFLVTTTTCNEYFIFLRTLFKNREIYASESITKFSLPPNENKNVNDIITVAFHQNNLRGTHEERVNEDYLFVTAINTICFADRVGNICIISHDYVL